MKIFKDNHIIEVSPDAYKTMYKRLGYEPVIEKKAEVKPKIEEVKPKEEVEEVNLKKKQKIVKSR